MGGGRFFLVLVFILLVEFVSAVEVDFDCPDEIFVDEEFYCDLEVFGGDGYYDVKVELDQERNSVLKIWDGEKWLSGYYYLIEFIEDGGKENVMLLVSEAGDYDGFLKLRQGSQRDFFEIEMSVSEADEKSSNSESSEELDFENRNGSPLDSNPTGEELSFAGDLAIEREEVEVIFLNGKVVEEQDEVVYISKDARVADSLIYVFSLFLIFIIGFLLWERRH